MKKISYFILLSRPIFLLGGVLLYALGTSIAVYLGESLDWEIWILGLIWTLLLQLGGQYLNEYFDSPGDLLNSNRTFLTGGSGVIGPGKLFRRTPLTAGLICLALLAFFSVILIRRAQPEMSAYWIMAAAFLAVFFYSTPPVRLEASGYGELIVSALVAFLVPAFAFNLQTGQVHRLLAMTGFPLTALHMAMLLAFDLPDYAADLKTEKNTLLVRLGWQAGINLHNILVLSAYLIMLAAGLFGYPRFAVTAGLLSLPIGLFQIWQMRAIGQGAKPFWSRLTITALTLLGVTAYLLAYSFWVN